MTFNILMESLRINCEDAFEKKNHVYFLSAIQPLRKKTWIRCELEKELHWNEN